MSARDVWAVGFAGTCNLNRPASLIARWDGRGWHRLRTPVDGELNGVAVTPAGHAWAIGDRGPRPVALILHWNGMRWRQVPSPSPARGSRFWAVAAASASSASAVGCTACAHAQQTLIVHWDGSAWRRVPSPSPADGATLYAVTTGPGGRAWAVGSYRHAGRRALLIVRWTGHAWTRTAIPRTGPGVLNAVAASSGSAWAAGCTDCNGANQDALILRWNGTAWTRSASPARVDLYTVAAGPRGTAWAAGVAGTGYLLAPPAADPALDRQSMGTPAIPETPGRHQPVCPGSHLGPERLGPSARPAASSTSTPGRSHSTGTAPPGDSSAAACQRPDAWARHVTEPQATREQQLCTQAFTAAHPATPRRFGSQDGYSMSGSAGWDCDR